MGIVQVFTAARMLAIEAASVISGAVDGGSGHLILTKHDGSTVDAGNVVGPAGTYPHASTTAEGTVFLASDANAVTGTDAAKAVTPHALTAAITPRVSLTGVVSSTWSSGPAPVLLDAGLLVTGTVNCYIGRGSANVQPGDKVVVEQIGGSYFIVSAAFASPPFQLQIPVLPINGWANYSDTSTDSNQDYGESLNAFAAGVASPFYVTKSTTGLVHVEGLLYIAAAPAQGSIIAQLPAGFRPERTQFFGLIGGGNAIASVYVTPDGNIHYNSGSVTFFSLSNVRFRAAGTQTFVPLVLTSKWAAHSTSYGSGDTGTIDHRPGYTVDSEGVYVFEGMATAVTTTAANELVQTAGITGVPGTNIGTHQACWTNASANGFARISGTGGTSVGNFLNVGSVVAATQAISFANMILGVPSLGGWSWIAAAKFNSWNDYSIGGANGNWEVAGIVKLPSGTVMLKGLEATASTVAITQQVFPPGYRSRYRQIRLTSSNSAYSRLDFNAQNNAAVQASRSGALVPQTGSGAWWTNAGQSWAAYN